MPDAKWTPEQLYIHFSALLDQHEELLRARLETLREAVDAAQRSVNKTEEGQSKRNDDQVINMQALSERISHFPTREIVDTRLGEFDQRLRAVAEDFSQRLYTERDSKAKEIQSIMLALANRVTTDAFDQYIDRQDDLRESGRRANIQSVIAMAIGLISLAGGIIIAVITHAHG